MEILNGVDLAIPSPARTSDITLAVVETANPLAAFETEPAPELTDGAAGEDPMNKADSV